jgi:monovalent cation/hydrogen antiporter
VLSAATDGHAFDLGLWGVLLACAGLLLAAYRTGLPYPILLTAGGVAIGYASGFDVTLAPSLVLVIFLPPLLYAAAFFSSLKELRANVRPISLLAIGLVAITVVAVAVLAHAVIGLPWAAAFTLGAIVSPTDPVAASAIASRSGAPRRFVTIVEGESLLNDSTGLIFYRFALAAAVSGSFSLVSALGTFVWTALAGVAIGVAVGIVVAQVRRMTEDAPTEITISLLTPYFAYLPAEALGASAVLAAVTSGVWLGWRSPTLISPSTRIQAYAVWELLVFVLNAALFVLVGLQLPAILRAVLDDYSAGQVVGYGAAVTATVILVRFAWVFPATYLPRRLRRVRERDPSPPWRNTFLVAFTGMRGAVSLAAALALPTTLDSGAPFPGRDLIVYLVYVVIFATVIGQGLALAPLIRRLGVEDDGTDADRETKARIKAARAALARLEEIEEQGWAREETLRRMKGLYEFRIRRFAARFDDADDGAIEDGSQAYQRLRRKVLEAERGEVVRLRNEGWLSEEAMHRIERDLDLEDARLEI